MNQCIMPRADTFETSRAHMFQVRDPLTCSTEASKVSTLRALVKDTEDRLLGIERLADKMQFLRTGELVAALVMETSIGFLDLAASAFSGINPAASKAAKGGVFAIKSAGSVSQAVAGQSTYGTAAKTIADSAVDLGVDMAGTKASIAQKVMLDKAKAAYDSSLIIIKSSTGTSKEEIKKDGFDFAKDRLKSTGDIISDGLEASKHQTAGSTLKGLMIVGEMYESAMRYQTALEGRFDNDLASYESDRQMILSSRLTLRNLLTNLKTQLNKAVAELESCDLQS